jgi:peptidyl-prolyl cis-trans isomerase D
MATLQSIRNHGKLLLVILGIALLAFILGDFLTSGSSFFNTNSQTVAEIADEDIHINDYLAAVDQLTEAYKVETQRDPDDDTRFALREDAWKTLVMDKTLSLQAEEIGMSVTADELTNLCLGATPHPVLTQSSLFLDENKQFSKAQLENFLNAINQEPETPEQAEYIEQLKRIWKYWENYVRITHLQQKYSSLLTQLVTSNPLDAKFAFDARKDMVDAQYVVIPYSEIEASVEVTDKEIEELYNQKKEVYRQKPNRSIEYVSLPIVPSSDDLKEVEDLFSDLESSFATGSEEELTTLLGMHSDIKYSFDYTINTIPSEYQEFAFGENAKKDACTEITLNNNTYSIARIMDCGYSKPDSIKLSIAGDEREGTWYYALNSPELSEAQIGDTITIPYNNQEIKFVVEAFNQPIPQVKLAILQRTVIASSKTYADLYNQAKKLVADSETAEKLKSAAAESHMTITPALALTKNHYKINDLQDSRQIIKWVFSAEKDQISDVYDCGNQLVVAAITEVNDGDYRSLESVKSELKDELTNKKKAEKISEELKSASSLEKIAESYNAEIQLAEGVTMSSDFLGIPQLGIFEPAVVGKALALAPNKLSAPIAGNQGVYVITVGEKQSIEEEFNLAQETQFLNMQIGQTLPKQAFYLIEEAANIVDNRLNFE